MRNIKSIIINELTHDLRNSKSMTMMILLPIVFMLILGSALSKNFTPSMSKMNAIYTEQAGKDVNSAFQRFVKDASRQGIVFTKAKSDKEGLDSIKDKKYVCYIKLSGNPDKIEFYKNSRFSFEADFIEISINAFVQRYNALSEIAKVSPASFEKAMNNPDTNFTKLEPISGKKKPDSKSYYGITMLTMIIFYSMYTGVFSIRREKYRRTGIRLISSPIGRHEILIGKIIGCLVITLLQIIIVFLFSVYIQGAYWGSNLGIVFIILLSEAMAALAIGIGVSLIFRSDTAVYGILNIIPMLFAFLGGAFFSIDGISGILLKVADISPLRWVNQSIMGVIYNNNFSKVPTALFVNFGIALLFIIISSYLFRKEALQP